MRIIAGKLGGRLFNSPSGHRTHPMSEKMRGAIFNALGDIKGLEVLDSYGGSGALGLEAISRGAKSALFIELDKTGYKTLLRNVESLGVGYQATVVKAAVISYLRRNPKSQFDVILADPPYDGLVYKDLEKLPNYLRPGGLIVYSLPPSARLLPPPSLELVAKKSYGDAVLYFYRNIS